MKFHWIYIDIEETLIKSLQIREFLEDNCEKIKNFLKQLNDKENYYLAHIFTWGWKAHDDIDYSLVKTLVNKLEIPEEQFAGVFTKSDSVTVARNVGWLKDEHVEKAMSYMGMGSLGLGKVKMFCKYAQPYCINHCVDELILIDDLVKPSSEIRYPTNSKIRLINPKDL